MLRPVALLLSLPLLLSAQSATTTAEAISAVEIAPGVKQIRFRFVGDYSFAAGQYAYLTLPADFVAHWNGVWRTEHAQVRRPYSFATSPSELPEFELLVAWAGPPRDKAAPPGIASTYLHAHLQAGDRLEFSAPQGSLLSGHPHDRPVVMVAGGTGLAPFRSLLAYWDEAGAPTEKGVWLFFGARDRAALVFHDDLSRWSNGGPANHYVPALSAPAPNDGWQGAKGYINVVMEAYGAELQESEAYMAGPPVMVSETAKVLRSIGLPASRIHTD